MKLEEFKKAMESDATKRNEAQEKTIKAQNAKIREMGDRIRLLENDKRQLMARCRMLPMFNGSGMLCLCCGFRKECRAAKE